MSKNEMGNYQRYIPYKPSSSVIRSVFLYRASVKTVGGVKWGYINGKGVIILPPIYDHAGDFQNSFLAIVRLMERDGLIDTNGYFIAKPKYETIHPFSEGRATVINRDNYNVMDESGKILTEKEYHFIGDYKEGRALAASLDNKGNYLYGYLNRWGKEVIPLEYESATDFNNGKAVVKIKNGPFVLIGLTGKVLHTYQFAHVSNYSEGLIAFQREKNGKFGYINEQGKVVIEPQFTFAEPFIEGKAIVNVSEDFKNKYGLIDSNGKFLIKPIYESIISLGEKRVAVGKAIHPEQPFLGKKYALADTDGNMLTGFIYNTISSFENGLATATNNLYTFFIDHDGKRDATFPALSGSGVLQVDRSLIRGEIDFRLFYFDKKASLYGGKMKLFL
ncbi:WG repeat-containing protein [Neobacillus sp. PS3-34]|uniref:WG repeat-containing protein n=1 Tax=Neobacillus sp. PS3-34 TaxID=3070678 RepID=UPI0027DEC8E9|nr:WG repeat-containing protein [Neobacillus sp. PS3-34]WML49902.1 WG repeat-containing protein [Neobacillus sp. PS3-34]